MADSQPMPASFPWTMASGAGWGLAGNAAVTSGGQTVRTTVRVSIRGSGAIAGTSVREVAQA